MKNKTPKKMGRPKVEIDEQKFRALCRLKPTQEDVAAFFECNIHTIENWCKTNHGLTFSQFREQNLVHTRFMLVRTALEKAQRGDNAMIIFCLKNLCGWKDRYESDIPDKLKKIILKYSLDDVDEAS